MNKLFTDADSTTPVVIARLNYANHDSRFRNYGLRAGGKSALFSPFPGVDHLDITLEENAEVKVPVPAGHLLFAMPISGTIAISVLMTRNCRYLRHNTLRAKSR